MSRIESSASQMALHDDIPASPLGRSLGCLCYSNDLSSYCVESVWGRDGSIGKYSPPQGPEADLFREKQERQRKVVELERIEVEKREAEELLRDWQMASLVLQAFEAFVWQLISEDDKKELEKHRITNYHDVWFISQWGKPITEERRLARQVYLKIDPSVRFLGGRISDSKQFLREERHQLAQPTITTEQLNAFLVKLGEGEPNLEPIEIDVFKYLKETAIMKVNIEASRR